MLEGASIGTRLLAIDLHLITTEEGGDPVGRTWNEGYSSTDADIGTGVVDRKGPGWDRFRVVPSEVRPLQRKFAVRQPVGEGQIMARAVLGVARIEVRMVAVARVALALDDWTQLAVGANPFF